MEKELIALEEVKIESYKSIEGLAQIAKMMSRVKGQTYVKDDLIKMLESRGYTSKEDKAKFFELYRS